jgi:hypothetical protein
MMVANLVLSGMRWVVSVRLIISRIMPVILDSTDNLMWSYAMPDGPGDLLLGSDLISVFSSSRVTGFWTF